ncbi:MAG TPA: excinuclease ABC subunit C [Thermotoga sp.]|nr:excinuclease ABC subunit C [Thermotoga sp.]
MEHHSLMLDFENAARYRDILLKFEGILSSQGVVLKEPRNLDVITHDDWLFVVLRVRNGFLLGKLVFEMSEGTLDDFVRDFYIIKEKEFPKVIITDDISDEDYSFFGVEYFGKPRDEIEKDLLQRAKENLLKERATRGVKEESLKQLKEILGLHSFPERIDGIDIAHIQGKYTVGSLVVFQNGIPDKREYRHYKLNLENPDDYKAVYIIVKRRYEKHQLPDLLFVDGGKGQVMAALKALKVLKKNCPVVGLAKSEEKIVTEKFELKLPPSHPALKALVSVRDEAHRFANLFHKKIREKESLASLLDNIPGIGKKRKKELMKKFGTIDKIRKASIEELVEVVKSKKIAEEILKRV